jgi:hypothetical protein
LPPTISRSAAPMSRVLTPRSAARARSIWTRSSGLSSFSVRSASSRPSAGAFVAQRFTVLGQLASSAANHELDVGVAAAPMLNDWMFADRDPQIRYLRIARGSAA